MNQCVFGDEYNTILGLVAIFAESMYLFGGGYKIIQGLLAFFFFAECFLVNQESCLSCVSMVREHKFLDL